MMPNIGEMLDASQRLDANLGSKVLIRHPGLLATKAPMVHLETEARQTRRVPHLLKLPSGEPDFGGTASVSETPHH